ncbi:MAG TPA: hypothetical protein VK426_07105 [Methanobacterium sp.]|nr:hypothetical protein [Methanobacterium sp.]
MKYLREHQEHGQIYWGTIFDFLNQPICKKCATLKKLYFENEELHNHGK